VTGFIKKLFNAKPKADQSVEQVQMPPARQEAAFYLDADAAKTLGDLDYMRTSKSIRRTFPKAKLGKDNASVRSVSAMAMQNGGGASGNLSNAAPEPRMNPQKMASQPTEGANAEISTERRSSDSSLDMFRNMAREIRKG
jgi:hypothetical protein